MASHIGIRHAPPWQWAGWLADRPRLAPGTAAIAGLGAAAADVALFVLLASQLAAAPGALAPAPAAAAALASGARLSLGVQAARRCLTARAALA